MALSSPPHQSCSLLTGGVGRWVYSFLKNWTLPVAITVGAGLYFLFAYVPELDEVGDALCPVFETLLPLTIFLTLFVTFSKVDFHLMKLHRWQGVVLVVQLVLVALVVAAVLLLPFREEQEGTMKLVLEAVLICIIAPCASASPVVTAKLGGDLTQMTTFVLLSSTVTSLLIPAVFPLVEPHHVNHYPLAIDEASLSAFHLSFFKYPFLPAFLTIWKRLAVVLLLPLLLGAMVRHWVKPLYEWFVRTPDLGFYCWSLSLSITSGITMRNIMHCSAGAGLLTVIALLTLLTSFFQFFTGRRIGKAYGEHICTGQAMFQKNTGLAIWIAYTYLTPVASIGAGCYVLWQNAINSYELWQHRNA